MQLLAYLLIYPILWVISKLPFVLLYQVSGFLHIILFHVIGYRKKLVLKNLELCFPEKSHQELLTIRKNFYLHMCDLFLEMIKSLSMTPEQMAKHAVFHNLEVLDRYAEQNKSVVLRSEEHT